MATSMMSNMFVVLLIFLPLIVVSSEARLLPKFSTKMSKKIHSKLLLSEIVSNVRVREYHRKRSDP